MKKQEIKIPEKPENPYCPTCWTRLSLYQKTPTELVWWCYQCGINTMRLIALTEQK